jgi:hypothetical protein
MRLCEPEDSTLLFSIEYTQTTLTYEACIRIQACVLSGCNSAILMCMYFYHEKSHERSVEGTTSKLLVSGLRVGYVGHDSRRLNKKPRHRAALQLSVLRPQQRRPASSDASRRPVLLAAPRHLREQKGAAAGIVTTMFKSRIFLCATTGIRRMKTPV